MFPLLNTFNSVNALEDTLVGFSFTTMLTIVLIMARQRSIWETDSLMKSPRRIFVVGMMISALTGLATFMQNHAIALLQNTSIGLLIGSLLSGYLTAIVSEFIEITKYKLAITCLIGSFALGIICLHLFT